MTRMVRWSVVALCIAGTLVVTASNVALPPSVANLAAWVGVASGILGLLIPMFTWARATHRVDEGGGDAEIEAARRLLVRHLLRYWRGEVAVQQLEDPEPVRVRWRVADRDLMDHPENILSSDQTGIASMLAIHGTADEIARMAAAFRGLPRRRLVILGEAGSGKTTLAMLLLLHLLEHPVEGEPVPVFLTLHDWHPAAEGFRNWLVRRLTADFPHLRGAARTLVHDRMILPVIDGLDEVPAEIRGEMIAAWNEAAGEPLIVTCRTTEYRETMTGADSDVLTAAAVVEAEPVAARDVHAFLRKCLSPRRRHATEWRELLDHLESAEVGPLAEALTSPLALWLFRTVYVTRGRDPRELLARQRFPDVTAVRDHLLDQLVPGVLEVDRARRRNQPPKGPFSRLSRGWDNTDRQRWLVFLARRLHESNTRDIAWWTLTRLAIPDAMRGRIDRVLRHMVSLALLGVLAVRVITYLETNTWWSDVPATTMIVMFAFLVLVLTLASVHDSGVRLPSYIDGKAFRGALGRLVLGSVCLVLVGNYGFDLANRTYRGDGVPLRILLHALSVASLLAVYAGILLISARVTTSIREVSPDALPKTPRAALRGDMRAQLLNIVGIEVALPALLAAGVIGLFLFGSFSEVALGISLLGAALVFWAPSAGSSYLFAKVILCLRREAPWRLMSFLEESRALGLLRQVGPVYQFRHATLQDRLAVGGRQGST
ncbi:NACHT domain-containing protein [Plantactinospora sp. S1510]|uniref:NACHT domain-containing protein n=1 Tax=Plantactinospora alkalitolerans TaxID=2789879 RepID=A0ABS0H758_9ACTN|nr:NACHT domain-containing protein [Plantactinospora alkalitolerans]MBF9134301.1 NACHT domain-containing protein [Plantactinospora alkalitolerans]